MRAQKFHALRERAQAGLRALLQRHAGNDHQEQRADHDKVRGHVDPVGVGDAEPGNDEAAQRRANDSGQVAS